jgi:PAS domain S-box-containing protein
MMSGPFRPGADGEQPLRVLLVEDDEDDFVITRELLESAGPGLYELTWAAAYDAAVRQAGEGAWDVVLLDYRLGGHTAEEFLDEVRGRCAAPIIVLTGETDRDTDVRMMRRGAADYLVKNGLDAPVLERAIRYAVERARAHAAAAFLAAIVHGSHDAIIGTTLEGVVVSWNPAAERLYGFAAAEVVGEPLSMLSAPERGHEVAQILARVRQGEQVANHETERVRRDGGRVPVAITVSPVTDPAGRVIGASAIEQDVTERREMDEQLRQAQKMEAVGKLAGGIAHDFNNLLTAIRGNADLMLHDLAPGNPMREDVEEIRRAADRAATLTRQILAFSRKQTLQPVVLDLNTRVAAAERTARRQLRPGTELVAVMNPELGRVRADPAQVDQVLGNLLANAREALPRGGRIIVETRNVAAADLPPRLRRRTDAPDQAFVALWVSDDGVGIAPEDMGRVFEPFFTTRPPGEGTGLGLSTVSGIVEQSGGRMDLTSEPGLGTTVAVYLPRVVEESAPEAAVSAPAPRTESDTLVLLVDDEAGVRTFARRVLERGGFSVVVAEDGEEALRLYDEHRDAVRVVVTDAVMPRMGGHQLRRQLAARGSAVPVLLVSGHTSEDVRSGAPGANAFLPKPFTADDLLRAVRALLAQS